MEKTTTAQLDEARRALKRLGRTILYEQTTRNVRKSGDPKFALSSLPPKKPTHVEQVDQTSS